MQAHRIDQVSGPTARPDRVQTVDQPAIRVRSTPTPDGPAQPRAHHHYTLHLDFAAVDSFTARSLACDLAEGLGLLRPEVETYSARVSGTGRRSDQQPVFCLAAGPNGEFCADLAGHPGSHTEAGINGMRWNDPDIPETGCASNA
jgi:hypothetical protein